MASSRLGRASACKAVRCGVCAVVFDLASRNALAARKAGRDPICAACRRPNRTVTAAEQAKYKRWWLEKSGLSRQELREIAAGLFGLPGSAPPAVDERAG